MDRELQEKLKEKALEARAHAYAVYSGYTVGAAVLGASGAIYAGCNVENASYGLTMCAERNAVFAAVAAGEKKLRAILIVGPQDGEKPYPCGACRQVLAEFAESPDMPILVAAPDGGCETYTLGDLLPHGFQL